MKWLIKISQSKPMPLPFEETLPGINDETIEDYQNQMSLDTALSEESQMPGGRYLGHGAYNVTYVHGSSVIKYTMSDQEAEMYNKQYTHPIPCVVKVLQPPKIIQQDTSGASMWRIVMEKIKPLSQRHKMIVDPVQQSRNFDYICQHITDPEEMYEYFYREMPDDLLDHFSRQDERILDKYVRLILCLINNNKYVADAHYNNIGWNTENDLVLFDLGGSE